MKIDVDVWDQIAKGIGVEPRDENNRVTKDDDIWTQDDDMSYLTDYDEFTEKDIREIMGYKH